MPDLVDDWMPLSLWPEEHDTLPTRGALRQRIMRMARQGLPVPFARRVGRLYYASPTRWLAWIDAREVPGALTPRRAA